MRSERTEEASHAARKLPVGRVLVGDALEQLRGLPSGSVDTVVTSPPYFMLRDYQVDGQIGLEQSVEAWVERLLVVAAEIRRVLKVHGSLWLNLGDTYARHEKHGARPKSLVCGPERLVLALVNEGWILRSKVIWAKPNPMPASVRDRFTATWEPLYLLVRDRFPYFDLDAVRQPGRSRMLGPVRQGESTKYLVRGGQRPAWSGPLAGTNSGLAGMKASGRNSHPLGKNPGDVWTIPTASYRGAHFATFPEALLTRPLLSTCPERVCLECGLAWRRAAAVQRLGSVAVRGALRKSCGCESRAWQPGVVLDPFMGAGTVGLVAERLNRRWVGIELKAEYAAMSEARIAGVREKRQGPPCSARRGGRRSAALPEPQPSNN